MLLLLQDLILLLVLPRKDIFYSRSIYSVNKAEEEVEGRKGAGMKPNMSYVSMHQGLRSNKASFVSIHRGSLVNSALGLPVGSAAGSRRRLSVLSDGRAASALQPDDGPPPFPPHPPFTLAHHKPSPPPVPTPRP